MRKLSNTKAELKASVGYKKVCIFHKNYLFLKTRGLQKVPYSNGSCSALIFCNQQIK